MFTSRTATLIASVAALAAVLPAVAAAKAPQMISCLPVKAQQTHGGTIRPNSTLSPIRGGKVRTIDPTTGTVTQARFTSRSGRWLTTRSGARYAVSGQWISASGTRGGRLQIASPSRPDNRVLCSARTRVSARAADTASYASDGSLGGGGYLEVAASTTNVSGEPLDNYATRDVCVISTTTMALPPAHPDGASLSNTGAHPDGKTWCYSYTGAGLNDMYGAERSSPANGGMYIDDPYHRHFITYNGSTVAAAKRPSYYPGTCKIVPGSKIAWRTVVPNCTIAN